MSWRSTSLSEPPPVPTLKSGWPIRWEERPTAWHMDQICIGVAGVVVGTRLASSVVEKSSGSVGTRRTFRWGGTATAPDAGTMCRAMSLSMVIAHDEPSAPSRRSM